MISTEAAGLEMLPEKRDATLEAVFRGAKRAAIPEVRATGGGSTLLFLAEEALRLRRFCCRAATDSRSSCTRERMLAASLLSRDCREAAPTVYLESELGAPGAAELSVIAEERKKNRQYTSALQLF